MYISHSAFGFDRVGLGWGGGKVARNVVALAGCTYSKLFEAGLTCKLSLA